MPVNSNPKRKIISFLGPFLLQLRKDVGILQIDVTVQDGGKTGAKAGVKLAY